MLTKSKFSIKQILLWTRYEILVFTIYAAFITFLIGILHFDFLKIPWTPIALVGTAVAFILGFQNNAAYGRIWEARKIWGGIVNSSRSLGMKLQDMISNEYAPIPLEEDALYQERKTMVYRHIAWLTALRYSMRTNNKKWEVFDQRKTNTEWRHLIYIPEMEQTFDEAVQPYLSKSEIQYLANKKNKATALLYLQSKHLRKLKESKHIWEFAFLELENLLETLFTHQGKSERIKNFPYPRQYASIAYYFVRLFLFLIPLGIAPFFVNTAAELASEEPILSQIFLWLSVPFSVVVSWIFYTMERIGHAGENPFESTANDVPISAISRGIEIDLRQLLGEDPESIPTPFPEHLDVQM